MVGFGGANNSAARVGRTGILKNSYVDRGVREDRPDGNGVRPIVKIPKSTLLKEVLGI